jgi:hypothetical protein
MFEKYFSQINNKWFFETPAAFMKYLMVYVNGDSVVIIPFLILVLLFGFFSIDFMLILIGLFVAVRCFGEMIFWNRQGKPFTHYKITESMKECIRSLNLKPDTEYVFNGELLHTKAKSKTTGKQVVTDTIALFDVLFIGKYLLTETLEERLLLLNDICRNPKEYALDNQGLLVVRNDESQIFGFEKRRLR